MLNNDRIFVSLRDFITIKLRSVTSIWKWNSIYVFSLEK